MEILVVSIRSTGTTGMCHPASLRLTVSLGNERAHGEPGKAFMPGHWVLASPNITAFR